MVPDWSVRYYQPGDELALYELWQVVYPGQQPDKNKWLRWWRWMYRDRPSGSGRILLAEHQGKIVGHTGQIPQTLITGQDNSTWSLSADDMVHPDYRHQGMYEALMKVLYPDMAKDGIYFSYGFSNELSRAALLKNPNYFDVAYIPVLVKPINWRNTLRIRIRNKTLLALSNLGSNVVGKALLKSEKIPAIRDLTITRVASFEEHNINEYWKRASSQYEIRFLKSKAYLNWRYVSVPEITYLIYLGEVSGEIVGYLVLRFMPREGLKTGVIFEVMGESENITQCLIAKAVERSQQEGADIVYTGIIAGKSVTRAFAKNGFISLPFMKGTAFGVLQSMPDISSKYLKYLKDTNNWLVQLGDSDLL